MYTSRPLLLVQAKAATAIQRAARGKSARKTVEGLKSEKQRINGMQEMHESMPPAVSALMRRHHVRIYTHTHTMGQGVVWCCVHPARPYTDLTHPRPGFAGCNADKQVVEGEGGAENRGEGACVGAAQGVSRRVRD